MTYDHKIYVTQVGLKKLGFDPGALDGVDGPKTQKAYRASAAAQTGSRGSIATKLVVLAMGEVGVKEKPKNSNRGKRVEEYQATTWLEGSGWAWCAAFICWLCKEAGVADKLRPLTAGAWDFERWASENPKLVTLYKAGKTSIMAGDILVYTFSHIGLAKADQGGTTVRVVEGNTDSSGSREGGGVYARSRKLTQIRSIIRFN